MNQPINHIVLWSGLLALTAALAGCRRAPTWDVVPVEGTITKNGRPLAGLEVTFRADAGTQGPRAQGTTDETGRYRLRTDAGGDGTVVGKFRVCLVDRMAKPDAPEDRRRVPADYGRFNETPLRADVHPDSQIIDFNIP